MNNPKKVFFGMLGVIGLIVLAGLGVFYYADSLFANNAREIADLKADDAILEEKIRKGREIEQQLNDIAFLEPVIEEVLPSVKEQSNLIGELSKIEAQTGITLLNINFPGSDIGDEGSNPDLTQTEDLESIGTVKLLPVTTSFECVSFEQLLNFLEKTEENRRKMQVSSISINRRADPNDAFCDVGSLDVNLIIGVYVNP
ncbi:MAG: hypothetical protein R3313_01380 [Candidatus Saccharimonadales bacterium]|nr:hypothetical protein [Candidatus Saccharimonadales bacterium]